MDTILVIIGPTVGLIGLAWAVVRDRRSRSAQRELREGIDAVPRQVANILGAVTATLPTADELEGREMPELLAYVGYADVTNDGQPELLIEHASGAHSMTLKVFGTLDISAGFEFLGELSSGTGDGFDVGDFDGDGQVEIGTIHADFDRLPDRAYYNAVRVETFYRWNGSGFEKVGEGAVYDPERASEQGQTAGTYAGRPLWAI